MEKFINLKSIPSYLPLQNIDTDMIIPKQFLKTIKRTGLGKSLFYEMRYDENEKKIEDFILNNEPYSRSKILIAGKNFGCGSSREHAPISIKASGVSCVIAATFARIFYRNSFNIGLPILECEEAAYDIDGGDEVEVNFSTGEIFNLTKNKTYKAQPLPKFMQEIISKDGLINYISNK